MFFKRLTDVHRLAQFRCHDLDLPTSELYLTESMQHQFLINQSTVEVCAAIIDSLKHELEQITEDRRRAKYSLRSLFRRNEKSSLDSIDDSINSQIQKLLVPAMYRFMISQICSTDAYKTICKPSVSDYNSLIALEKEDFKYESCFNIIWHTQNPSLLFKQVPSLLPSLLRPILTDPCSDTVTRESSNYMECARDYAISFMHISVAPNLILNPVDFNHYGLLMDFIHTVHHKLIQPSLIFKLTTLTTDLTTAFSRTSKSLLSIPALFSAKTEQEILTILTDAIPESVWHIKLQPHLSSELSIDEIERRLTEKQQMLLYEGFLADDRLTMEEKFDQVIADIFQPVPCNGEKECLKCFNELTQYIAKPSCECNYVLCHSCVAEVDAVRKTCLTNDHCPVTHSLCRIIHPL
jgi:hypothetical protein